MFRTKSLTNKEMKNLIQKNRPSQTHKQNRNFCLRSLIADKTLQYHKHMERLVQETNELIYSNKKNNKKRTPKNILDDASNSQLIQKTINQFNSQSEQNQNMDKEGQIQQFEPEVVQYLQVQSMPTYQGSQMITQQNQSFSVFQGSANRTAFKINLQNLQLNDENKQLRRQIEHLQQRLQTAQLIKIQKQSQSQSYKLKLKILQLQIMKYRQKQEQRTKYFSKFTTTNPKNIKIVGKLTQNIQIQTQNKTIVEYECQTNQTIQDITTLYKLCQQQTKCINLLKNQIKQLDNLFNSLQRQPDPICLMIQQQKQDKKQTIIDKISLTIKSQQTQNQFYKNSLTQLTQRYQQLSNKNTQLVATHIQLQAKSDKKIKTLIQLLNLAEKQIKILLNKLRQNKNNTVTNYKQMISNVYKIYQESNDQHKKQIMNNILFKANQTILEKQ